MRKRIIAQTPWKREHRLKLRRFPENGALWLSIGVI
jgi:hypothetical protein